MGKIKQILTNWRVILLLLVIAGSVLAISPKLESPGVEITSIEKNSSAYINGVQAGELVTSINGVPILTDNEFYSEIIKAEDGNVVKLSTDKTSYSFIYNATLPTAGLEVKQAPTSNLRKGLDIIGGVRALIKPEEALTPQQFTDVIDITQQRLNAYGLSDVAVRKVSDFDGNDFLLVEMAGTTKGQIIDLITQQGKFEAKINNITIFAGGNDIKQVGRSVQEGAGLESCGDSGEGFVCNFRFPVTISIEAAEKHAAITKDMPVIFDQGQPYLNESLDLYLDDAITDTLRIGASLKGKAETQFQIQGSGSGATEKDAQLSALDSMKTLQTLLITGSLPVKLNVAKTDIISPVLGEDFFQSSLLAILIAIFAVAGVLFIRYRNIKVTGLILLTDLSEFIIILGVAALIKWQLDLAAIAGIIAAIGTGVDDQIVITDEVLSKGLSYAYNWKEKIKRAFFIIFGSYATVIVAMIPLWALGAGLLRGFAIVTIIGVSVGVFITRPAYAKMLEILSK